MTALIEELENKIDLDFPASEAIEVKQIINKLYHENKNLGFIDQVLRSLIFLSEGQLSNLKYQLPPFRLFEPRDIIIEAEECAGNLGHWFGISFDEIEKRYGQTEKEEKRTDNKA